MPLRQASLLAQVTPLSAAAFCWKQRLSYAGVPLTSCVYVQQLPPKLAQSELREQVSMHMLVAVLHQPLWHRLSAAVQAAPAARSNVIGGLNTFSERQKPMPLTETQLNSSGHWPEAPHGSVQTMIDCMLTVTPRQMPVAH